MKAITVSGLIMLVSAPGAYAATLTGEQLKGELEATQSTGSQRRNRASQLINQTERLKRLPTGQGHLQGHMEHQRQQDVREVR